MSAQNDDATVPLETDASSEEAQTRVLDVDAEAPNASQESALASVPRPRIRWASVIWGALFVATGWLTLWTLADETRRNDFLDWMIRLGGTGWTIVGVVALGAFVIVIGLIAGLRRLNTGPAEEARIASDGR